MKPERYLVTTSVGTRSWHVVWEGEGELALDHPVSWSLSLDEKKTPKLSRKKAGDGKSSEVETLDGNIDRGIEVMLPATSGKKKPREVHLRIQRVRPILPAHAPTYQGTKASAPRADAELFVYAGIHQFLLETRKIGNAFGSLLSGRRIFAFGRAEHSYKIKSYTEGVVLDFSDGEKLKLRPAEIELIPGPKFEKATIRYGNYWWRVNQVNRPADLTGLLYEEREIPESLWFKRVSKSVGSFLVIFAAVAHFGKTWILSGREKKAPVKVEWKQPKFLPPTVALKKIEPVPKPVPKKEEPPKVVEKAPPKKPVVKKEVPKPPVKLTKTPPPKPLPPVAPAPAVTAQKELAKSLSFLSPSKSRPAAPLADPAKSRYKDTAPPPDLADKSKLRDLSAKPDTAVDLRSTREITADGGIKQRDKALNSVQGKVALNALYDPNAAAGLGVDQKGFSVSGAGTLSSKEVEKALSKFLAKFQYCYEKALLSDPSAAGTVVMQWTVGADGSVSGPKVLKSQIANHAMQSCLAEQIAKVPFPKPSGGEVTIQYPFAFSSSSL